MQERLYQKIAINNSVQALVLEKNTMLIAPTGAGKTFMLARVIDELLLKIGNKKRVLVCVHRSKINFQNEKTFKFACNRKTSFFVSYHKNLSGQVIFGMIQTIANCYKKLPAFDVVVIDEFHHSCAETYTNLIEDQKSKNPNLYIFGVTATPNRRDKESLGKIVTNYSAQIRIQELIELKYLVPPIVKQVDFFAEKDMNTISKSAFFHKTSEKLLEEIKLSEQKKIIIFVQNIAHLEFLLQYCNENKVKSVAIHSKMDSTTYNQSLYAFEKEDARVLINIDIATEGYDYPPIDCVVLMRAITHKGMFIQMVGRGLRTIDYNKHKGFFKKDCLVLDFGRNFERFKNLEEGVKLFDDDSNIQNYPALYEIQNRNRVITDGSEKDVFQNPKEDEYEVYTQGYAETFVYKDTVIKGMCGYGQSIFFINTKFFLNDGRNILEINEEQVKSLAKNIIGNSKEYFDKLKELPIAKHQIQEIINDFDIVGCTQYRASVLINFLIYFQSYVNQN